MIRINITAETLNGAVKQIQESIGGNFIDKWGEEVLSINNNIATGHIRFLNFDYGVNLLEYKLRFKEDVIIVTDTSNYNPINFFYCLAGRCSQGFNTESGLREIEQFQSVIISNKESGKNSLFFPKEIDIELNIIQIIRRKFIKKRLNNLSLLNDELHNVFMDTDHDKRFAHYGTINLVMADHVKSLRRINAKGMIRILQLEAKAFIILSLHIQQHNLEMKGVSDKSPLLRSELKIIRSVAKKIIKNPAHPYTLREISSDSGLSQAKLQDGFKYLYKRTVTEFIRFTRLKTAKELMNTTDLNISEIVYTIGFTSRSYFSKIFKEQYNLSPNEYKKHISGNNAA